MEINCCFVLFSFRPDKYIDLGLHALNETHNN